MMGRRSIRQAGLALALLAPAAAWADDTASLVGTRVRLTAPQVSQNRLVGQVIAEDAEAVNLQLDATRVERVPRSAIKAVEVSRMRSSKGHGAGVGFLTGVLIGGVLGFTSGDSNCNSNDWFCIPRSETTAVGALFLGGIGALIGAVASPGEQWDATDARRVQLSLGPTRGRGFAASLRFAF